MILFLADDGYLRIGPSGHRIGGRGRPSTLGMGKNRR